MLTYRARLGGRAPIKYSIVADLHQNVVGDYRRYVQSFLSIADDKIRDYVEKQLVDEAIFWPDALLQLNPGYRLADEVDALAASGILYPRPPRPSGMAKARLPAISASDGHESGNQFTPRGHFGRGLRESPAPRLRYGAADRTL
jgi:hypothetical protein